MKRAKNARQINQGYVEKKLPDCKQAGNFLNNETNFIAKEGRLRKVFVDVFSHFKHAYCLLSSEHF